jgi:hypothetical protein
MGFGNFDFGGTGGQITVKITGLNRTIAYFERIAANLPMMTEEMTKDYAKLIRDYAEQNIISRSQYLDVQTDFGKGTLADSLVIEPATIGDGTARYVVKTTGRANLYASIVEKGRIGGVPLVPRESKLRDKIKYMRFKWSKGRNNKGGFKHGFYWKGRHYFTMVKQGPSKPMWFMRDAIIQASAEMRERMKNSTDDLIKGK